MNALENVEAMLDEIMARVQGAVPSEGERAYIESGIRTAKHWVYQAMRESLPVTQTVVVDSDGFELTT